MFLQHSYHRCKNATTYFTKNLLRLYQLQPKFFRRTKLLFFINILPSSFGGGRYRMPGWDQYNGTDPRTYKVIWNYCWVGYSKLFGFPGIIQKNRYIPSYKTWNNAKNVFKLLKISLKFLNPLPHPIHH